MSKTADLLALALDKNPVDFATQFDEIIREKTTAAVEAKRVELAQSIYGDGEAEEVDTSDEIEDENLDIDGDGSDEDDLEIDLDDIDLDLDDLDLDIEDSVDDEA